MSKFNMSLNKVPMPEQEPKVRAKNFLEVTLGYTAENAMEEAKRCLQCKNPKCVGACPVNIKIPNFIAQVAKGNIEEAYKIISEDTLFPSICGRVCPQETQCEGDCIRGIKGEPVAIGRLERFVGDDEISTKGQLLSKRIWFNFINRTINEKVLSYINENQKNGIVVFKPNISELSKKFEVTRPSLSREISLLCDKAILKKIHSNRYGVDLSKL